MTPRSQVITLAAALVPALVVWAYPTLFLLSPRA